MNIGRRMPSTTRSMGRRPRVRRTQTRSRPMYAAVVAPAITGHTSPNSSPRTISKPAKPNPAGIATLKNPRNSSVRPSRPGGGASRPDAEAGLIETIAPRYHVAEGTPHAMRGVRNGSAGVKSRCNQRQVFIDAAPASGVYGRYGARSLRAQSRARLAPARGHRCMDTDAHNGHGAGAAGQPGPQSRDVSLEAQRTINVDQASADADQSSADADQTASDSDQAASAADDASSDLDQVASDRDQATADRDHASEGHHTDADDRAYDTSRDEREANTVERLGRRMRRAQTAAERDLTAVDRDRIAEARDKAGRDRDGRAAELAKAASGPELSLEQQLEFVRAQAAADRARAAADRERAALDRANAARERARLEAELQSAHLDDLTGAYRREMGQLTLSLEIDRARRSDGRFVVAFVDVDELKLVNDRDGHA